MAHLFKKNQNKENRIISALVTFSQSVAAIIREEESPSKVTKATTIKPLNDVSAGNDYLH